MKNIAAIDLGTNTIRLLIGRPKQNKKFDILYSDQKITRTGQGLSRDGYLKKRSINKIISVLWDFKDKIDSSGVKKIIVVATSALREAKNSEELIGEIKLKIGFDVNIISGEEEGRLTLLGVTNGIGRTYSNALIVDIGGGSTEFIRVQRERLKKILSVDLGVVSLTEGYLLSDSVNKKEILEIDKEILKKILAIGKELRIEKGMNLIGTAGTFTTLVAIDLAIKVYNPERVNGHVLTLKKIKDIFKILICATLKERKRILGLERGREDLIIPGTAIVIKIMEHFHCKEVIVSDYGLREGILIDSLKY